MRRKTTNNFSIFSTLILGGQLIKIKINNFQQVRLDRRPLSNTMELTKKNFTIFFRSGDIFLTSDQAIF